VPAADLSDDCLICLDDCLFRVDDRLIRENDRLIYEDDCLMYANSAVTVIDVPHRTTRTWSSAGS